MIHHPESAATALDWLCVDVSDAHAITVRVKGAVIAERTEQMWEAFEWALENAAGRLVIADMTRVETFDQACVAMLLTLARTVRRRRDNFVFAINDSGE